LRGVLAMNESVVEDPVTQYAEYLTESGLSERTVKSYVADLRHFAAWIGRRDRGPLWEATAEDIRAYSLDLATAKAHPPATVNRRLQAIRKFFKHALESGLVDGDPSLEVKLLPAARREGTRGLDGAEIERLLAAVRNGASRLTKRDYAIVQLMLQTGIRVGELTRLRMADLESAQSRGLLRIHGDGVSEGREVPLNSSVRKAVDAYLAERAGATSEHLFLSVKGEPLSVRSVQRLVNTYAEAAGLENVSTYTLRHTCGQRLLRDTGDLPLVARVMGHKRLETAIKYIVPGQEDLTEVAERSSLNVY
jgi:site-specific recombinase XerD